MFRSFGAVLLGYVTFMVLVSAFAVALMLMIDGKLPGPDEAEMPITVKLSIAYVVAGWFFAAAGGYVTAWVARRRELAHALALTALTFVLGVVYFVSRLKAQERPEPLWYLVVNVFLPLVSIPVGGWLRARHVASRGLAPEAKL